MSICFDTNVLAYAIDATAGPRHATAADLVRRAVESDRAILILQTLGEFYSVATRKLGTTPGDARAFLARLRSVLPVYSAIERDLDQAMEATQEHGLSFWDAMLWATAAREGGRWLLGEDFQDGRVLGPIRFVNPFSDANQSLLDRLLPPVA